MPQYRGYEDNNDNINDNNIINNDNNIGNDDTPTQYIPTQPYHDDTHPNTDEMPVVNPEDYNNRLYNDNDFENVDDIEYVDHNYLAWENLPDDQKSGDWVAKQRYIDTYNILEDESARASRFAYAYSIAYNENEQLQTELEEAKEENIESNLNKSNLINKNNSLTEEIEQLEDEIRRKEETDKWKKIASYILIPLFLILAFVFFLLWRNAANPDNHADDRQQVQQEQVTNLKNSLENERQAKNDAVSQQQKLQEDIDKKDKDLQEVQKNLDSTKKQLNDSDKALDELNDKIDELENQTAEKVTETETVEVEKPGEAQTITETANGEPTTVTETVTNNAEPAPAGEPTE